MEIKMDEPLAQEYSGDKKRYTYKMFESLQYGQSDNEISRGFEQTKQIPFEFSNPVSGEEDKGEQNDQLSFDDMDSSSSNSEQEFDSNYKQANYDSLVNEIKELRNDFKI